MQIYFYTSIKGHILFFILVVLFGSFSYSPFYAQSVNTKVSLAEKIYLQLDATIYTTDQTIWFKSIVTNAVDHTSTTLSGVLYVELIGPDEKIIEKKLIKIDNGIGDGFFELNQAYAEGLYLIRTYTEWNKNFDSGFFFKQYIHVFTTSSKKEVNPIRNVTLVNMQNNKRRIKANFDPLAIDSLHKNKLTIFITLDEKKDTLTIKKNKDDKYQIDYAVPDESQFITLQFQTNNFLSRAKTIALNKDYLDLQFFPESGELVYGIQSKVGFKALDSHGKGKRVTGEIIDGQGEVVAFFNSNQLGMGGFMLNNVDSNDTYFARLTSQSKERPSLIYPLPDVAPLGNVLSVNKIGKKIRLIASSNYLKNDSIYIQASCRGMIYYEIKGRLTEGVLVVFLAANKFPEGIIAFTMMDRPMHSVAERLYFNERPESRIHIKLSTNKNTYSQRELSRLTMETTNNDGEVVNANLSLLVLNKEQMGQMQSIRQNILSYFLLSSDLKGEIENPGFYFSKESNSRHQDQDALLLTQGWRKYRYTKSIDSILFQPEPGLSVSGVVSRTLFQNKKKAVELTMMTFGNFHSFQSQTTDSLGRFNFNVDDEYGHDLNILIQSAKKSGEKKNYKIVINKKESPDISFDHIKLIESVDSVALSLVKKNIERKMVEDAFRLSTGITYLDEVVIEGYKMTPERKIVMEKYGKPELVISGEDIAEKEEKWSYGLYSVLLFNFRKQVIIERQTNGELYASVVGSPGITLVVVDGVPVLNYNYGYIEIIPPSEVSSFEIIKNAKNFRKLFLEAFPGASPIEAPYLGSVIAIYTKGGKGLFDVKKPIGIVHTSIPVFSPPREFYTPKYQNISAADWVKPDLRALVHWAPNIKVDSLGKASMTFYNADNIGEMQVVVEAISEDGEIGYQEMFYNVKRRKTKKQD